MTKTAQWILDELEIGKTIKDEFSKIERLNLPYILFKKYHFIKQTFDNFVIPKSLSDEESTKEINRQIENTLKSLKILQEDINQMDLFNIQNTQEPEVATLLFLAKISYLTKDENEKKLLSALPDANYVLNLLDRENPTHKDFIEQIESFMQNIESLQEIENTHLTDYTQEIYDDLNPNNDLENRNQNIIKR